MQRTTRLRWPYPDEKQKGWYPLFKDMMSDMDLDIQSAIDCTNTVVYGGELSLNIANDTVSWSEEIGVYSLLTGFRAIIEPGSITGVVDGSVVFLETSRSIDDLITGTLSVDSMLSTIRDRILIAKRVGDSLYMNNGLSTVVNPVFPLQSLSAGFVELTFGGVPGLVVSVEWGDDSPVDHIVLTEIDVPVAVGHTYSAPGPHDISIGKSVAAIKKFSTGNDSSMSVDLSDLSKMPFLEDVNLSEASVTGSLSDVASVSTLKRITLENTLVTGNLGQLNSLSNIERINLDGCSNVTGSFSQLSAVSGTLTGLRVSNTSCDPDTIDDILAVVGPMPTEIGVGGLGTTGEISDIEPYEGALEHVDLSGNPGIGTNAPFPAMDDTEIDCRNCSWTETQVDNFFINADSTDCHDCTFNVTTGNAARSSASDAAVASILSHGCVIL